MDYFIHSGSENNNIDKIVQLPDHHIQNLLYLICIKKKHKLKGSICSIALSKECMFTSAIIFDVPTNFFITIFKQFSVLLRILPF